MKKILYFALLSIIISISCITLYKIEYNHRIFNPDKPQFFELKDAASDESLINRNGGNSYRYYMIQACPDNEGDLRNTIHSFLNSNYFVDEMNKIKAEQINIYFMVPSWDLPVFWTNEWMNKNNWKYWDGDIINPLYRINNVIYQFFHK